jgi:molybdopterin synthase catalytic subunit
VVDCTARITSGPIKIDDLLSESSLRPAHGAQVLFTGMVRNHNLGKQVLGVSYDAFEPLAEKVLLAIGEEARKKWGEVSIRIVHRVGRLEVGEISVAILVTSPHRKEAWGASQEVIEKLKTNAPIWKKEHYGDGESQWLKGHSLCGHQGVHANV